MGGAANVSWGLAGLLRSFFDQGSTFLIVERSFLREGSCVDSCDMADLGLLSLWSRASQPGLVTIVNRAPHSASFLSGRNEAECGARLTYQMSGGLLFLQYFQMVGRHERESKEMSSNPSGSPDDRIN